MILTLDPSLTAFGWAVLTYHEKVVSVGCVKTEPGYKKKRIRKGDDTVRRISEINNCLIKLIKEHNITLILSELPHGSQNANAAQMIGATVGIVQGIADCFKLPVEWYSEGDSKKSLLGKRSATKNETISAVDGIYDVPWKKNKYQNEAIADAISVYHCAKHQSPTIRMLQKMKQENN
jgi:Holliday junction resolvasome RuvABC endonuclease subunit